MRHSYGRRSHGRHSTVRSQGNTSGAESARLLSLASLATGALMVGRVGPAAAQTPAQLRGTRLSILQWVNFVPAHDAVMKKQVAEWEKLSGVKVTLKPLT